MCLMGGVLLAMGVPLASAIQASYTHEMFLDRLNDTARFAAIAQLADVSNELAKVGPELRRYDAVYGIRSVVLAGDGSVRLRSSNAALPTDPLSRERISDALGGRRSEPPRSQWPREKRPMVVAEPLIRGGDAVGAIVTISPTDHLSHRIMVVWVVLIVLGLAALVACYFAADRLARWVLHPVGVLDSATHEIATGKLEARVSAGSGPTELRRLAMSFNDMADNVEASHQQQRAFVADASHQLRNPLSALLLRLEDVASQVSHALRPDAMAALEEGKRLTGTLDGLLELARSEHATGIIVGCDVCPIVRARMVAWQPIARARRIELISVLPRNADAWADESAIMGALDVLLDNALKFSPEGTTVTVQVSVLGDRSLISVRDEGPGLTAAELDRVGNRFWRGGDQQNVAGSGLGLAIARALLEPAEGYLDIAARVSGGLDVRLWLRRAPVISSSVDTN
jgi:signal transduction histidine kinase